MRIRRHLLQLDGAIQNNNTRTRERPIKPKVKGKERHATTTTKLQHTHWVLEARRHKHNHPAANVVSAASSPHRMGAQVQVLLEWRVVSHQREHCTDPSFGGTLATKTTCLKREYARI